MLSIFAIPKAFRGHSAVIQRNAIKSWTLLEPLPEILLFGEDEGTEQAAQDFGVRYMGPVLSNDFGTPLISDVFLKARSLSSQEILCYVNADIILTSDFLDAVKRVASRMPAFVMAGQRWTLDIRESLDFSSGWQERLHAKIHVSGQLDPPDGIDYFVFPRKILQEMPPFAVGRPAWDNWFLFHFRCRGIPLIDATTSVTVVHQKHDYSHVPQRSGNAWEGPEADRNRELATGYDRLFTLQDRTHRLTPGGIAPVYLWQNWQQRLKRYAVLHPNRKILARIARSFSPLVSR